MRFLLLGLYLLFGAGLACGQEWSLARALRIGNVEGAGCAVDSERSVYVMGAFDHPVVLGTNSYTPFSETDTLLMKYSRHGELLWVRHAGSFDHEVAGGVAVGSDGAVYSHGAHYAPLIIEGITNGTVGHIETFLAKYDRAGNFQWVRTVAGQSLARDTRAVVDDAQNVYVTGTFIDHASLGSTNLTGRGWSDVFVTKFDGAGNQLWAVPIGSEAFDRPCGIATHGSNAVYVTGTVSTNAWFGSLLVTNVPAWQHAFVARLDEAGKVIWARLFGRQFTTEAMGVAADRDGNVIVTGHFQGVVPFGNNDAVSRGFADAFVVKLNPAGEVEWVRTGGGANEDMATTVTVDSEQRIYVAGRFESSAQFGEHTLSGRGSDMFVVRYSAGGAVDFAVSSTGLNWQEPYTLAPSADDRVWLLGFFMGQAQFGQHSVINLNGGIHAVELVLARLDTPMRLDARKKDEDISLSWASKFHVLEQSTLTNQTWTVVTNRLSSQATTPASGPGALFRLRRD